MLIEEKLDARLRKLLRKERIPYEVLTPAQARSLMRRWSRIFCANQHAQTGRWKYQGFYWYTFSHGWVDSRSETAALRLYRAQSSEDYFVVSDIFSQTAIACGATLLRDINALQSMKTDFYVFPADFSWTMVVTHHSDIGPYFCRKEWQSKPGRPGGLR